MTTYLPIGHPSPSPTHRTAGNRTPVSVLPEAFAPSKVLAAALRGGLVLLAVFGLFGVLSGFRALQHRGLSEGMRAPYERVAAAQIPPVDMALGEQTRLISPGDTLWAIAVMLAPNDDPRPIVDALADRNGGSALRAGDTLIIPADLAQKMGR